MRSMPSTSSVTCSRKISATLRGRLMIGSGRWRSFGTYHPLDGLIWERVYRIPCCPLDRSHSSLHGQRVQIHLVGLRRSLVRDCRLRGVGEPDAVSTLVPGDCGRRTGRLVCHDVSAALAATSCRRSPRVPTTTARVCVV